MALVTKEFKFKVGDRVYKSKGYTYRGVVVAAFLNLSGEERYVVEVDGISAKSWMSSRLDDKYNFTREEHKKMLDMLGNCNGMLHIFSGEQLELSE